MFSRLLTTGPVSIRPKRNLAIMGILWLCLGAEMAAGADPEGCQLCHRYRGLGVVEEDTQRIRLFYVDPTYYDRILGPHAALRCTDCHERSEVERLPHEVKTRVDCTQTCHLVSPGNVEVRFAHEALGEMLDTSVHGPQVMEQCNLLLGEPLYPDQSSCLFCHDEPMYRREGQTWAQAEAPVERCRVCHDERLPIQSQRYFWHVHARSMPARTNIEQIRVCAVCHNNDQIRTEFNLPNSISSYAASFHGKAAMLGTQQTAGCLDCHVGPLQNVHQMQSHTEDGAPTHASRIANTCRTPRCHPTAGQQVESAVVHLDLSTSRGIEYFIAGMFILLIISTFGPSVFLTLMDMLQIILGRHDPDDVKNHHRAEKLMADPQGRKLLKRFTVHQRFQHWILVICFAALVFTGFPMKFADAGLSAWFIGKIGGLGTARIIHRVAGLSLLAGFVYHLLIYVTQYLWNERKKTKKSWLQCIFSLPMVMSPADFKKMGQYLGYLFFFRRRRPQWGRFSLEEKFEYFGVIWGTILLGVTGLMLLNENFTSRFLPGRALTVAALIHGFEAYLAVLHVGIVHLAHVLLAPASFPCSVTMFTGDTSSEELAELHAAMLDDAEKELALRPKTSPETVHE